MNDQPKSTQLQVIATGAHIAPLVPSSFEDIQRVARMVHASGMAPKAMKTAEAVGVAIMSGLELGLPPMQAVQSITVINGRPAVYGKLGLALVRNSPLCEYVTEHFEGEYPKDDFKAVCKAKRKGHPEVISEFSVADAKEAGLWDERPIVKVWDYESKSYKDGPNPAPWFRFRKRMMQMRARNFALDDTFPDILRGFGIAESMDEQPQPPRVTEAPPIPSEAIEDAPFTEVAGQQSPAGTDEPPAETHAQQPPVGGSSSPSEDRESVSEILLRLEETLETATTDEEVRAFYAELDVEAQLTHLDADAVGHARQIKGRHFKRVDALAANKPQEPITASQTATEPEPTPTTGQAEKPATEAPKRGRGRPKKSAPIEPDDGETQDLSGDPFELPEDGYADRLHWHGWWTIVAQSIKSTEDAQKAVALWKGQQAERERLKLPVSDRTEMRGIVTKAIEPFMPAE